ncbi:MAG: M20/M25/M40 family metallo-hydrolase [Candidatus Lambdaproteobacteria bacterium]|nr:M20/M25/M40 family metallo-hydrolase [Candidatus Lambdaproteobacteria bacterium]
MTTERLLNRVAACWDQEVLPTLMDYMRIPNESPLFDRDWERHGHMARAVALVQGWLDRHRPPGARVDVVKEGARTPLLLVEVPGQRPGTALIYGHLDKQPPMTGWREGLGAWTPVLDGEGRLYGRGGADDGYAVFAALAAVKALQAEGLPHSRIVILIECSEESGSPDLPHYLQSHAGRIGDPDLILCLDSGCGDYDRLWGTTSLRGLVSGNLRVEVLSEGIHSGIGGGIVPGTFRILRRLLERLEDGATGDLRSPELAVEIPSARIEQARKAATVLGAEAVSMFPLLAGVRPEAGDTAGLLLRNTWMPSLAITAQEGLPELAKGGNVLLPSLTVKYSLRIPPTLDARRAAETVKRLLTADPPHGARVQVTAGGEPGWEAPAMAPWLAEATEAASRELYGREACYLGVGGSIPFMHMMGERFPRAQYLITGVLGPHANAHGPNEFLHVPYAKRLTACLVRVLAAHGGRSG